MIIIYILLTVIAVGVLLLTENGQAILGVAWKVAAVIAGGFILFYLLVGGYAVTTTSYWETTLGPWLGFVIILGGIVYFVHAVSNYLKQDAPKLWREKRKEAIAVIVLVCIILITVGFAIYQSILG